MTCNAAPAASGYMTTTSFSDKVCGSISKQTTSSVGICLQNLNVSNGAVLSSFKTSYVSTGGNSFKLVDVTYTDGQCTQNPVQSLVIPGTLNTCTAYGPTSYITMYSASPVLPELYIGGLELT